MSDSNSPYGYVRLHSLDRDAPVWIYAPDIRIIKPHYKSLPGDPFVFGDEADGSVIEISKRWECVTESPDEVAAAIAEAVAFYTPIIREDFSPSGGCI